MGLLTELTKVSLTYTLKLSIQMETHDGEILHANYSQFQVLYEGGRFSLSKVTICLYNIMYLLLCFGRYIYIPTIQIITQLGVFGQVSGCS